MIGDASTVELDRVDELAARLRVLIGRPVDALQVAAAIEADGIVDRAVPTRYGHRDVFDLAEEVYARIDAADTGPAAGRAAAGPVWPGALRDLSHGLLYLLPAVLLPALPALVGMHPLVLALLTASGLGWVWSAGGAWLGYRMLGRGLSVSAGRVLRVAALSGVATGLVAGGVIAALVGGGGRVVGMLAGLIAFQMSATITLVYRRELLLVATMAPAVAAGVARPLDRLDTAWTVGIGTGSVVLTFAVALWQTTRAPVPGSIWFSVLPEEPPLRQAVRPELARLGGVLLYAALSAGFLLNVDARYLSGRFGLAVAAAPLVLGMGLVEWRTRRFHDQATGLLHRLSDPRRFAVAVWGRLLGGLLTVLATIGVLAAVLVVLLRRAGLLDTATTTLIAAHVVIGGAFFLAFVLAGQSRYVPLCAALATAVAVDIAAVRLWPGTAGPLRDGIVLLACALLLQALLARSLLGRLGQAWRYSGTGT